MSSQPGTHFGQSLPRLEDPPLVRGEGCFVADISFPHQLHMRVVRSDYPYGIIRSIDTHAAATLPGVIAIWTAKDVADIPPIDFREGPIEKLAPYRQHILAHGVVRYVGDPVAVIFATTPYIAEDAADLVAVDIDERRPILSADEEPHDFAPGLSTEATTSRLAYGDLAAAFQAAHTIVELDLSIGRHSGVPLETRGAIGRYDSARDVLELYGAAKVPHRNRESLAKMLSRSTTSLHLYESHVGGGFGVRGEIYPEDVIVLLAALRFHRPVKWIEDRREHLMAANHSRQQRHKIRAAVDANGKLLGIENKIWHDQGAYIRTHGTRIADMTAGSLPFPYKVPAYQSDFHFRLTNKTPAATYRAPGRYEANFVRERLLDAIAIRLNISRIEVRRRNLIKLDEMPYNSHLVALGEHIVLDSGDYEGLLDKSLTAIKWSELEAEIATRKAKGELVGLGLAMFVEKSGLGPTDGARIQVDTTGTVEVVTGGASVGQGFETVIAQVCAQTLGVAYTKIRVVHGRTDRIEYGIGAHASRATVMTANATREAALLVRQKALQLASELLQTPEHDLDIEDGVVFRVSQPKGPMISLGEIADRLRPLSVHRGDHPPGLSAEGWFNANQEVYPYGVLIAVARVDSGTGAIALERTQIAYDIGRAINPRLVKGQIMGGFAQGLGGALLEEFRYDDRGQPLCLTFADYLIPTMHDVPHVDILISEDAPSPSNPLGIKGAGESGIAAAGAVIASAVEDALGVPGAIQSLPITPRMIKDILRETPSACAEMRP